MEKHLFTILAGGLLGLAGIATAGAQDLPGDPVLGRDLALKDCVECHEIEPGERDANLPDPPSFQNLADTPAMTPLALRVFLTTPHNDMPNLILADAEVDDLIAWIHSLKSQ
ncbi:MAG: cytochrome c [Proteobacteria bacterium]|nr:cytochrome c [Pseudomonadota bacterium]